MWRFKPSKYKNAAPKMPKKPEGWVTDISVGSITSSGNAIHASAAFVAFNIDSGGGGTLGVLKLSDTGSKRSNLPHLNAHADFVTSLDFCPYDDGILTTGSLDHHVKIWRIPYAEGGQEIPGNPLVDLLLDNAIETVNFHPTADCMLATADSKNIKLWDITSQKPVYETCHDDIIQCLSWKPDGKLLASIGRDKKLQIWDPREPDHTQSTESHANNRDARVLWLGDSEQILTSGFGAGRQREIFVKDLKNLKEPIFTYTGESSLGVLIPFYDIDTKMLFFVAKADTAVSFWELVDRAPFLQEVSKYVGNIQAKGAALVPKRGLNVMEGEVNRILILGSDCIAPLSYIVPRKTYRSFHFDLFPDTVAPEPTVTLPQWMDHKDILANTTNLDPSKHGNKPYLKFNHQLGIGPQIKSSATAVEVSTSEKPHTDHSAENNIQSQKVEIFHVEKTEMSKKPPLAPKPVSPLMVHKELEPKASCKVQEVTSDSGVKGSKPSKSPNPQRPTISFGIRASKFRHLNGTILQNETHITDIKSLTRTVPSESNGFEANLKFAALPLGPAGSFIAVTPINTCGRAKSLADIPGVLCGTKCLDFTWDPFNLYCLVTACDTGDIQIWNLDDLSEKISEPTFTLKAVCEKTSIVKFHPCAKDILCSACGDFVVRVWDLENRELKYTLIGSNDQILALSWSPDGQFLATVSKDQKLRIYDPRSSPNPVQEGQGPEGIRGARIVWVLNGTHIVVSGFNKVSERQVYIYDVNNIENPIGSVGLDVSPATLIPSYDEDSSTLFLTGKGDSTVYAYEVATDSPYFHTLSHYKCSGPHQALFFFPKIVCNVQEVEFARALRLTTSSIETLSLYVPRLRTEYFQDDIFPDTKVTWKPLLSSTEWLSGVNKTSEFISLKPEGMDLLSRAPAPTKVVSTQKQSEESIPIVFEGDVFMKGSLAFLEGSKEKEEQIVQSMMSQCQLQTNSLPQDAFDGVDPEEWEEEEREHAKQGI